MKTFGQHSDYLNWLLAAYSFFLARFNIQRSCCWGKLVHISGGPGDITAVIFWNPANILKVNFLPILWSTQLSALQWELITRYQTGAMTTTIAIDITCHLCHIFKLNLFTFLPQRTRDTFDRSSGKEEEQQAIWEEEQVVFLKPKWEIIFWKVSFVDVVNSFVDFCFSSWQDLCGKSSQYAKEI